MRLWKTLLLLLVVVMAWFFARRYFEVVVVVTGVMAGLELFRSRREGAGGPRPVTVAPWAELLGLRRWAAPRNLKLRRHGTLVQVYASTVRRGLGEVTVYDVATPTLRKVPFCFVARAPKAAVREAQLVENTRIPGVRFEYALTRAEWPQPLEAASNMADLVGDLAARLGSNPLLIGWRPQGLALQKLFFNGRVLHTHVVTGPRLDRNELWAFIDAQVDFHLTLLDLIDNVDFKVPT